MSSLSGQSFTCNKISLSWSSEHSFGHSYSIVAGFNNGTFNEKICLSSSFMLGELICGQGIIITVTALSGTYEILKKNCKLTLLAYGSLHKILVFFNLFFSKKHYIRSSLHIKFSIIFNGTSVIVWTELKVLSIFKKQRCFNMLRQSIFIGTKLPCVIGPYHFPTFCTRKGGGVGQCSVSPAKPKCYTSSIAFEISNRNLHFLFHKFAQISSRSMIEGSINQCKWWEIFMISSLQESMVKIQSIPGAKLWPDFDYLVINRNFTPLWTNKLFCWYQLFFR